MSSMRLQFGHGGEAVETRRPIGGHGRAKVSFNSATAVKPWRHRLWFVRFGGILELQFGHGGEAVETLGPSWGKLWVGLGFNSATAVKPWRLGGNEEGGQGRSGLLQFGHGGEAVETGTRAASAANSSMLQFGHGGEAVETNQWPESLKPAMSALQFGHGGEAVETIR